MKLSDYVQKIRKEQEATVAGILDSELPEVYKLKLFSEFRLLGTSRFAVPIFADCDTEAKNAAIACCQAEQLLDFPYREYIAFEQHYRYKTVDLYDELTSLIERDSWEWTDEAFDKFDETGQLPEDFMVVVAQYNVGDRTFESKRSIAEIARMVFAQCVKTGCIAYIYDW